MGTIIFFIVLFFLGCAFYLMLNCTLNFEPLAHYNPGKPSVLLDDEGNEWARFSLDRREPIALDQMPHHLQQAFIAAEDWHFFSHSGISIKGIIRSSIINILHRKKIQGASTITQQLVKLLFFNAKKTFTRKIKEQIYAVLIELQFTKEQILETYLNHVYFGYGIYGVEAAAQRFWAKSAFELTIAESATLAAIIRCPGLYCPLLNPLSTMQRRSIILNSMKKLGYINQAEYEVANASPLAIKQNDTICIAPHLKELIRMQLEEELGKVNVYTAGYKITTTLNKKLQVSANQSFLKHIADYRKTIVSDIDGGLISLEASTGAIRAMVGGFDFQQSKFNRAWQAKRQMGSVLKPLIYAAALEQGASFEDIEIDEPLTIEYNTVRWQPQNYNHRFEGPMTLAYALIRSNNIISIKTLLKTGIHKVVALAKASGIHREIPPYPSLALGCIDASAKEVVGMFNIFANQGIYIEPHAILWVKDEWGTKIWRPHVQTNPVIDPKVCAQVSKVMSQSRLRWPDKELPEVEIIAKTGTTNDCRTCWFAGATPGITSVVWVGTDDNRSLGNVYPLATAFPIWKDTHQNASMKKTFIYPPQLKSIVINQWTGKRMWVNNAESIEIFL